MVLLASIYKLLFQAAAPEWTQRFQFVRFDVKLCKVIQVHHENPLSCSNDVNYAKMPVKMHKKQNGLL